MSHEYAMSRVRDALEKSEGNHLKAQRLITTWVEKDQSLLIGLVGPHLAGIISHAVNHADKPQQKKEDPRPQPKKVSLENAGEFGAAIIAEMQGGKSSVNFGESAPRNIVGKPGKASQNHIDTINRIAGTSGDDKK